MQELICESYGMKAVAECLAHSASEETKEDARSLLEALAKSNPRYEMQIYKVSMLEAFAKSNPRYELQIYKESLCFIYV